MCLHHPEVAQMSKLDDASSFCTPFLQIHIPKYRQGSPVDNTVVKQIKAD